MRDREDEIEKASGLGAFRARGLVAALRIARVSAAFGAASLASHAAARADPASGAEQTAVEQGGGASQQDGVASYYGSAHHGRRTASGSIFDMNDMTAAHAWLPFGTRVRVTLQSTGREVVVVVTDRLRSARSVIDLSFEAARELGMLQRGIARVTLATE